MTIRLIGVAMQLFEVAVWQFWVAVTPFGLTVLIVCTDCLTVWIACLTVWIACPTVWIACPTVWIAVRPIRIFDNEYWPNQWPTDRVGHRLVVVTHWLWQKHNTVFLQYILLLKSLNLSWKKLQFSSCNAFFGIVLIIKAFVIQQWGKSQIFLQSKICHSRSHRISSLLQFST